VEGANEDFGWGCPDWAETDDMLSDERRAEVYGVQETDGKFHVFLKVSTSPEPRNILNPC